MAASPSSSSGLKLIASPEELHSDSSSADCSIWNLNVSVPNRTRRDAKRKT